MNELLQMGQRFTNYGELALYFSGAVEKAAWLAI
jgi:hypothetical protein